jgi:D-alanyl-D-alanine carboxypeptidase/D-alanyl-D-alanine-endopeptidase (penicillin-binding protein 4)
VIRDINKFSNNVMARQLLLTLGSVVTQLPGNTERGAAVVRTWLAGKGIDAPELAIENGSGLSRSERISAATMGRLLVAAFRSPTMPEFVASLSLVGQDGTMRQRLTNHTVSGKAHIKTGLLNEVRNIAGYVLSASSKRYVVVCMINHPNAQRGKDVQDALLQWVYERG